MVALLVLSVLGISGILGVGGRPDLGQIRETQERDLEKIVKHISSISTSLGASKVDFHHYLRDKIPPNQRLEVGLRVLRQFLRLQKRRKTDQNFRLDDGRARMY